MIVSLLILATFIFTIKRQLTYLHIFQQQEYHNYRFLAWIISHKAIDKRLSSVIIILILITNIVKVKNNYLLPSIIISFLTASYFEKNPTKTAKKKLVLTNRAKRIYGCALAINLIANILLLSLLNINNLYNIKIIIALQLTPIYLILANLLLIPIEKKIQQHFWQQAKQKIITNKPFIIGITGSFGKTSVKHFLGHILQYADHTLITPGSINTTMGISRIIREQLNAAHRYFIVEMGAYGIGSIKDICNLTTPDMAIITTIGNAHYERFKTLETVACAKFELAQAAINNNKNSKVIISDQALNTQYAKQFVKQYNNYFDILTNQQIPNISQLKAGLAITLNYQGNNYKLEVPVFGIHHANNIALAFIAARIIGLPTNIIINSLKTMPQITHRLEVIKKDNCIVIDDAYNANPIGFKSALELLNFLHEPPGRRILVTPGLIELGTSHDEEHFKLGQTAASYADITLVVKPQRIPSFVDGFKKTANQEIQQLIAVKSFAQAKQWLDQNCQIKDTILLANDLPDLYETGIKI